MKLYLPFKKMRILTFFTLLFIGFSYSSANAETSKRIALSFDDAPRGTGPMFSGNERSEALIAALAKVNAGPVAFFVTTKNLDLNDNRVRIGSYAKAGHLIANHSHNHPWLHKIDAKTYIEGIDTAESLLEGFDNRRPWFRFPYLDEGRTLEKRDKVRQALTKRGLKNGYVTVDNFDWYLEQKWLEAAQSQQNVDLDALRLVYIDVLVGAVDFFDSLARETLDRSPAHVLLLHENDLAALFIDDLVVELRKQGWEIISPDEAYQDPIASKTPQTLMAGEGLVAALAVEKGIEAGRLSHLAVEETQIDQLLADRLVFRTSGALELSNPH